ncbi:MULTISPECIES: hypothetical protein [Thermobacillus]|uniref:hypothetical protein n=1 Tax=Thermobacillus TaxID=76632 RepID=UPI0012F7A570|nr:MULTISPECIES: hypothetical protein [Thermobacillus]
MYTSPDYQDIEVYLDSGETVEAFVQYARMMPGHFVSGALLFPNRVASLGMVRATEMHHVIRSDAGDYRMVPLPVSPSGERWNTSLLTGLAIPASSNQQELAWALMSFIVGDTSEAAMDFLARNTLEVHHQVYRDEPDPRDDELRAWIRSEAVTAAPASFDLFMTLNGAYDANYPYPSQRIGDYNDSAIVREDLNLAAQFR